MIESSTHFRGRQPRPLTIESHSLGYRKDQGLGINFTESPASLTPAEENKGEWKQKNVGISQDGQTGSSTRPKGNLRRSGTDLSQHPEVVSQFEASQEWLEASPSMSDIENEFEHNMRTWAEAQSGSRMVNRGENEKGDDCDSDDETLTAEKLQEILSERSSVVPPDTPKDAIKFIQHQLDENYRGQAEILVRGAKSRSSSARPPAARSFSTPAITRSLSDDLPGDNRSPTRTQTSFYTSPRPIPNRVQRSTSLQGVSQHRTSLIRQKFIVEAVPESPPALKGALARQTSGETPTATKAPLIHATYGHQIDTVPSGTDPFISKRRTRKNTKEVVRGPLYFTEEERQHFTRIALANVALANKEGCKHTDGTCQQCIDFEYAYLENKAMPTSIPPEERQKIINNNRSLRNIKNELENLAEHGAISDDAYDMIMKSLPEETSLNGSARANPAPSPAPAPTNAFATLKVNNDAPPPAYQNQGPPSLPSRGNSKPEVARATALYRYAEPGDCNFEVGDEIVVFEKMNPDWWLGKNQRTGTEGVFPMNYVQEHVAPSPNPGWGNEKAQYNAPAPYQQPYQQGPPPPGPSNPYNSSVPPMAVAETPTEPAKPGKGGEMGKKFGKKLGNAAIFGAGATIGGNIVNSIF